MGDAAVANKILMVEPGLAETESLTRLFTEEGYRMVAARDGGAALTLFRSQRPDLVLIKSDDEAGLACCRSIREEGDVPVVMLSCSCALDDKGAGLRERRRRCARLAFPRTGAAAARAGQAAPGPQKRGPPVCCTAR